MLGLVLGVLNMLFHFLLQEIKLVKLALLAPLYRRENVLKVTQLTSEGSRSQIKVCLVDRVIGRGHEDAFGVLTML